MQPVSSNLPCLQEESVQSIYCSHFPERGLGIDDVMSVLGGETANFTLEDNFIDCLKVAMQGDFDVTIASGDCEHAEMQPWQAMPDHQHGNQDLAGDMTSNSQDMACLNNMWGVCLNNVTNRVSYPGSAACDASVHACKLDSQALFSGSTTCSQASNSNFFNHHSPLNSEATSHITNPCLPLHQGNNIQSVMEHKGTSNQANWEYPWTPSPNSTAAWSCQSNWQTLAAIDNTFLFHPSHCFTDESSSHKPAPSLPTHELNLEARANLAPPQLNLEVSISQAASELFGQASPFQLNLMADHNTNGHFQTSPPCCHTQTNEHTKGEGKSAFDDRTLNTGSTREGSQMVQFLVECSTPTAGDGYVWRKYGQKNIKNKVHPRAYFRCAQNKCCVKKQTEWSSEMPGFVLITYIGRHNH